jgi:[protein-PII] uridylyltransferase
MLPDTEAPLWATLELSYFVRHDAAELAWHARELWRYVGGGQPVVRARPSPVGEGLQVLVYARDMPDLFARICGYFDGAGFNILDAKMHTTRDGYGTGYLPGAGAATSPPAHRDLVPLVEQRLTASVATDRPCPNRAGRACHAASRASPTTPRVQLSAPMNAPRPGCCRSRPATAPACSTPWRGCWRATR